MFHADAHLACTCTFNVSLSRGTSRAFVGPVGTLAVYLPDTTCAIRMTPKRHRSMTAPRELPELHHDV